MKLFTALLFLVGTFIVIPILHIILINFVFGTLIPINIKGVVAINIITIISAIIVKFLSQTTIEILTYE